MVEIVAGQKTGKNGTIVRILVQASDARAREWDKRPTPYPREVVALYRAIDELGLWDDLNSMLCDASEGWDWSADSQNSHAPWSPAMLAAK